MRRLRLLLFLFALFLLVSCNLTLQKITTTNEETTTTITTTEETTTSTELQTTTTTELQTTTTELQTTTTTEDTNTSSYDATYYYDALGLTGDALKAALHDIIDDNHAITYDALWEALANTDKDPNNPNNIIEFYSGISISNQEHGGLVDEWNREHVWAKSHGDFGTAVGPGTDLFNIHPTDVRVNSLRGNLDFDNGGSGPVDDCDLCKKDGDSFEPRDEVKGDVARTIFYMAVRYEGDDSFADLELNNLVNNDTSPFMGKLSVLLEWNRMDPVSDFEMNRNNIIYEDYQHNRNPFIDHPEWVDLIWDNN